MSLQHCQAIYGIFLILADAVLRDTGTEAGRFHSELISVLALSQLPTSWLRARHNLPEEHAVAENVYLICASCAHQHLQALRTSSTILSGSYRRHATAHLPSIIGSSKINTDRHQMVYDTATSHQQKQICEQEAACLRLQLMNSIGQDPKPLTAWVIDRRSYLWGCPSKCEGSSVI